MSIAFAQNNRPAPNPTTIQKMLDENGHLIQTIQEYQCKGRAEDCVQYQQMLHRNLVYIASVVDSHQNPTPSELPEQQPSMIYKQQPGPEDIRLCSYPFVDGSIRNQPPAYNPYDSSQLPAASTIHPNQPSNYNSSTGGNYGSFTK